MLRVDMTELIEEVRITLDENAQQSTYLKENRDNLELDEIIRAKLPEAARDVTEQAEVEQLEPEPMVTDVTPNSCGGTLTIPEDYLRLVSLKMKGWNRSVTVVAGEGSDIDHVQRNAYTRGTKIKPVAVMSHDATGKRVIEYFGTASTVERALYMPIPNVDGSDRLGISRTLRQAIVRRAAGLVLLSRGEAQLAQAFLG